MEADVPLGTFLSGGYDSSPDDSHGTGGKRGSGQNLFHWL